MSTKRLFFVVLALVTACPCRIIENLGGDSIILAAQEPPKAAELDPQLELTRDALLDKGSSDQMRVNAAAVMLLSDNLLAREILLDALKQTENDAVRKAVCKAALQRRMLLEEAPDVPLVGVVGRFVMQKGLDLLAGCIEGLVTSMRVQVGILGAGDKGLEWFFGPLPGRYPLPGVGPFSLRAR